MSHLKYGIKLKLYAGNRFDLSEIMAPIGEELLRCLSWKIQMDFFVVHHESEFARNAEFVAPVGAGLIQCRTDRRPWSYEQLERFSREKNQVVDGDFIGYKTTPKGKKEWVVLKPVDSSFWEVWAGDQAVIEKLSAAFPRNRQEVLTDR